MPVANTHKSIEQYYKARQIPHAHHLSNSFYEEQFVPDTSWHEAMLIDHALNQLKAIGDTDAWESLALVTNWEALLFDAVLEGDLMATRVALEHADPMATDHHGNTALFYAQGGGTVRALVDAGCNVYHCNKEDENAIHIAIRRGRTDLAHLMRALGAGYETL